MPTAPEGGRSSSAQLPAGSNLTEHFQKTGVTGAGVRVLKQLGDKEMAYARTKVVSKTPRSGRSGSPKRGSLVTSNSEQEESHDTALLAMDENPRQRRNELKRRVLERRAFIAERISIPQGSNKNRRKQMAGTNLTLRTQS